MKRQIIFAFIATVTAFTGFCEETTDTILTATGRSSAIITESPTELKIVVRNLDDENAAEKVFIQQYAPDASVKANQTTSTRSTIATEDGVFCVRPNTHWSVKSGGLCFGLVNAAGQPDGLGLQWSKSIEISWVNALAVRYSNGIHAVSLGIGFDWRNYKITTSDHRLCLNGLGGAGISPYPEVATQGGSRIKVFSLGFPLLYSLKIPGTTLSVTAGGILNFNTHASLQTWYSNAEGNHTEEYTEDFHPRRVSADLFASIGFIKNCGLYVRYSPCTVLHGHGSPSFRPLSVGVTLFL